MHEENKKYPEGYFVALWMGLGAAIFSGFGIPLAIFTKNSGLIAIGPALGVSFGLIIGQSIENKYKKEGKIRPLTKDEKKKRQTLVTAGIVILTVLSIIGLVIFLQFL